MKLTRHAWLYALAMLCFAIATTLSWVLVVSFIRGR